jgi:hypothetical protein
MSQGERDAREKVRKSEDYDPESESKGRQDRGALIAGNKKRKLAEKEPASVSKKNLKRKAGVESERQVVETKKRNTKHPGPESNVVKEAKTSLKKRRVSVKSVAEAKGMAGHRRGEVKTNADPNWKIAQAPHPCAQCIERSEECNIFVGKVNRRRRVVCVRCRTRKGGCSLNFERQKMQYMKGEEESDEGDNEEEHKEAKTKGKLKGIARARISRTSQKPPQAVKVKSENDDDPEWCLGEFNLKNPIPTFSHFQRRSWLGGGRNSTADYSRYWG